MRHCPCTGSLRDGNFSAERPAGLIGLVPK